MFFDTKGNSILKNIGLLIILWPSYMIASAFFKVDSFFDSILEFKLVYPIVFIIGYVMYVLNCEKELKENIKTTIVVFVVSLLFSYLLLYTELGLALCFFFNSFVIAIFYFASKMFAVILLIKENKNFIFSGKIISVFFVVVLVLIIISAIKVLV